MAGSVNKVILVGNVGKEPEIKVLNSGTRIANFSIATSDTWRDKQTGEKKEKTEWHRVVVYNEKLAEIVEKYVKKGSKIYVEGQLQTRKWQDQAGNDKYSTEVVIQAFNGTLTMLEGRRDGDRDTGGGYDEETANRNARPQSGRSDHQAPANGSTKSGGGNASPFDDEIPF